MGNAKEFDRHELSCLLEKAESYKRQMEDINKTYKDFQEYGGTATLYIYTENHMRTQTPLDEEVMIELFGVLQKKYEELIKRSKEEVDKLYEGFL